MDDNISTQQCISHLICLPDDKGKQESDERPIKLVVESLVKEISALKAGHLKISAKIDSLTSTKTSDEALESTRINPEIARLEKKLQEITNENKHLKKRNLDLQNENASLLTSIRLLQGPQTTNFKMAPESLNDETSKQMKQSSDINANEPVNADGYKVVKKKRRNRARRNRNNEVRQNSSVNSGGSPNADQGQRKESNTTNKPPTTIILGDSIVKRLNSFQMSKGCKKKVLVRSFPGARVKDMYHYMKPVLEEVSQPTNVVFHIGTNDLGTKTPQAVADEIQDLARHTESKYPGVKVTISSITKRYDSNELTSKVDDVNKITKRYCNQSGKHLITHTNIDDSSVNVGKLHLNNKGVAILANNLTNFIVNHR